MTWMIRVTGKAEMTRMTGMIRMNRLNINEMT